MRQRIISLTMQRGISAFFQSWEFAHRFSERIARCLRKNEQMSDSLKKTRGFAHGRSFLVSDLSESLIFGDRPERFAHIANFW